ncbi:hypothetical protein [Prochlorococcus sp. MIT 1341]|uniref:hypothetical protein n=1 Tax=Prochlorococcus sp. MIT 1341 TaxID=3096221 RepID=UPI002A764046|nr:hypothetical protein [Prochlorococcus sp. MIT 1341]
MAAIQDHEYLKVCALLARHLSISLSSARRRVDLVAAKEGARDIQSRKNIAMRLLEEARLAMANEDSSSKQLDNLLEALAEDENFMVED